MEIKIKNIGKNDGTSGWLKEKLENGIMYISEGVTQKGKHGLWINYNDGERKKSMCLALYNPYDMDGEYENFSPLSAPSNDCDPGAISNIFCLTPAAIRSLLNIAKKWCNKKNEEREADSEIEFDIIFK